jgi:hypothetical protein
MRGFLLLIATVIAAFAQDRAGNQIFRLPPGWTRTDQPGVTFLSPPGEPPGMVMIALSGRPLTGDYRSTFDQELKALNGASRVIGGGEVQNRRISDDLELLATTIELDTRGVRSARFYIGARARDRYEAMLFVGGTPALFQKYWPVAQQFISTWTFANVNAPAPASSPAPNLSSPAPAASTPPANSVPTPAPAPDAPKQTTSAPPTSTKAPLPGNRLDGVYGGFKYIYTTVFGQVQRKLSPDRFSFLPDGRVFWGLPETGLANFNFERECQNRQEFCGYYQINGKQLAIVLDNGKWRENGSLIPGGVQVEDRTYTLQGDISKQPARMLEGDFKREDALPHEALATWFLRFNRDGTFVDQGIVGAVTSSKIVYGWPQAERPSGSGTYTLGPYTILLRYSDGYVRQLGVTLTPEQMNSPSITQLTVNTYSLIRRR